MELKIRKALFNDAKEIAEIHKRSWKAAYTGIIPDVFIEQKGKTRLDMWQKILSVENNCQYVLVVDGMVVGIMTVAEPQDNDLNETYYEIFCYILIQIISDAK
mgnify:CR=1 FL=1